MKKNIWIMNHYATEAFFESGGRHYWFAKNLISHGYSPMIFCANVLHNSDKQIEINQGNYTIIENQKVPFTFIKTSPYKGNGLSRIQNILSFFLNLFTVTKRVEKERNQPDIIIASSVHPLTCVAGILIARRYHIPCVVEIRDLWPETIVQYSRFGGSNLLIKLLYTGEKWIYKKANGIIFTMEGGYEYIKNKGWDKCISREKVFHINNGIDLSAFDENLKLYPNIDADLNRNDKFKVVYAGSIRKVNNLGIILEAAKFLSPIDDIVFLIWGSGDELDELKKRVVLEGISNVTFKGRVEKKLIPGIVSSSNVNLVHWEMSDILKYGCSYNKLFEYLAAGKPIVSTVKTGYSIIEKFNCGIETTTFTPEQIAQSIVVIHDISEECRNKMGSNARKAAESYDFKSHTEKLIDIIESI